MLKFYSLQSIIKGGQQMMLIESFPELGLIWAVWGEVVFWLSQTAFQIYKKSSNKLFVFYWSNKCDILLNHYWINTKIDAAITPL